MLGYFSDLVVGAFVIADHHFFLDRVQVLNREKKKLFLIFLVFSN